MLKFNIVALTLLLILGLFIAAHLFIASPAKIGTVNITGMIDRFIKEESKKNVSPDVLKQEVKEFGSDLDRVLQRFSRENHPDFDDYTR